MTTPNSLMNLEPYVREIIFSLDVDVTKEGLNHCFHLDYESQKYSEAKLAGLIRDSVEYFALTPEEFEKFRKGGDTPGARRRAWSRISTAKKNKKGDYGELLLFLLLYFKLPQRVPRFVTKVRLRSSSGEQIKGFDCAHFTIENNEPYLWLGEAKFHQSISSAIASSIQSLKEHSRPDYLRKELNILGENIEANHSISSDDLEQLEQLLNKGRSLDRIKFKFPILLTYDSDSVKKHGIVCDEFLKGIKEEMTTHFDKLSDSAKEIPNEFTLLFLLIPFDSVANLKARLENIEEANR